MSDIFNRMAAERARALVERQNPVAWKINGAALDALKNDRANEPDEGRTVEELPLFGLPVIVDRDDRSEEPRFALVALNPKEDSKG